MSRLNGGGGEGDVVGVCFFPPLKVQVYIDEWIEGMQIFVLKKEQPAVPLRNHTAFKQFVQDTILPEWLPWTAGNH